MDGSLTLLQLQSSFGDKMPTINNVRALLGLTSCHLEKKHAKGKKEKNRACIGPRKNRACRVSVFDTAHHASTRSITAHTAFFSSTSGFTTVDTTLTCSIWGCILLILPGLSAIRPLMLIVHQVFAVLKYFQKLPLLAEGEACRENRQNSVCFLFRRPTKLTIRHVLMNTRFSKSERTAVRITRTCVENRKATSDKRQATSDI